LRNAEVASLRLVLAERSNFFTKAPTLLPDPVSVAGSRYRRAPNAYGDGRTLVGLTRQELESRLLAAADSLRGPVDPTDFKACVFPLLFFKRLSDAWDAEHAAAVADYGDSVPPEALPDYHRFALPPECHWRDLRRVGENVGHALQLILDHIQEANPRTLAGIFGEVAWANKERLPEPNLLNLVDVFDRTALGPADVPGDVLGDAYEYLLRYFADASGKKAGEFFTPRAVVRLLTRLLDPQPGESIYDPACGSGGMLVEAIGEVRDAGADARTLRLFGQEVNLTTAAIARMILFLHDIEEFTVVRGDTLRDPKYVDARGGLRRFDVVISNPPFSLKKWGAETWANDPHGRAFCGVPPAGNGDYAWIEHMLSSVASSAGRVGVVMPNGALFRGGQEGAIRECLVGSDLLDAVVGLPPNLFYSTSIPACLLIFRTTEAKRHRGKVLFVDASERFTKGRPSHWTEKSHQPVSQCCERQSKLSRATSGPSREPKVSLITS
jgi:type I restriction enzyme M protein